jgi:hypothetical protein
MMGKRKNSRDYGLNADCEPKGAPKAIPLSETTRVAPIDILECPNCKCTDLMEIQVEVSNPVLSGGGGVGYYIGCPACPYASPMLAVANTQSGAEKGMEA